MTPDDAPPPSLYDLTREEVDDVLEGEPRYRTDQLWDGLYTRAVTVDQLTDLPASLRQRLAATHPEALTEVTRSTADGGDTIKWLWELRGGAPGRFGLGARRRCSRPQTKIVR